MGERMKPEVAEFLLELKNNPIKRDDFFKEMEDLPHEIKRQYQPAIDMCRELTKPDEM